MNHRRFRIKLGIAAAVATIVPFGVADAREPTEPVLDPTIEPLPTADEPSREPIDTLPIATVPTEPLITLPGSSTTTTGVPSTTIPTSPTLTLAPDRVPIEPVDPYLPYPTLTIAPTTSTTSTTTTTTGAPAGTLPTAAVAIGDSFISGEGAGSYLPVDDRYGTPQYFPGWNVSNTDAYFCHRSANASIEVAALSGIDERFNLACSGGQPRDIGNPSYTREFGRQVASQLDQLEAVAATHDIDVVLIGLGSNNSYFTFGDAAKTCARAFLADAWVGWWEFWAGFGEGGWPREAACTNSDLASPARVASATTETTNAVRLILQKLAEVDADGEHRIVFQDYTNPLPPEFHARYYSEDGRTDTRDKFRALGRERYAAGCTAHRASLGPAYYLSTSLGTMVRDVRNNMAAEFPDVDLIYLNVQQAFDGARLCERDNSPVGTLVTPSRFQKQPNGSFATSLNGWDKLDISKAGNTCKDYMQTCQESWHPNAAGHAVLGQCLSAAAVATSSNVTCRRSSTTGAITTTQW